MVPLRRVLAIGILALMFVVAAPPASRAQQGPTSPDTSRGLLITYADGHMHTKPLRPRGAVWTAGFPRMPGATPTYEGLKLSALEVRHVVEGADVVVTVSLRYGGTNQKQVKVATVRLQPGARVEVNELRGYGVEPITLSIVSIPETASEPVEVVSVSPLLELRAEQNGPNASSYRVTLTNRSDLGLMWIRFEGYRDGKRFSGGQAGDWNTPLVLPKSQHAFEVAIGPTGFIAGDAANAWSAIDRIEVTSLMWQDGAVEGERSYALTRKRMFEKRTDEIRAVIAVLEESSSMSILDSRISALSTLDAELRLSLAAIRADLDKLSKSGRSRDDLPFESWRPAMAKFHRDWLNRIVMPKVSADK